jgi:hypothetical protein
MCRRSHNFELSFASFMIVGTFLVSSVARVGSMAWHPASLAFVWSRPVLVFGFLTMAFFLMGPQMGSVDVDGDGFPEVPVAVSTTTQITESSSVQINEQLQQTSGPVAREVNAIKDPGFGTNRSSTGLQACYPHMQSSSVLRC